jgi:hypothetical protein
LIRLTRTTFIRFLLITLAFALVVQHADAQFGGQTSYDFLNLPQHARLAALGGVNVSHNDRDVNFFLNNPALCGDSLAGWASASYLFYVADIGQAAFAGTFRTQKFGAVSLGMQHVNYGDIEGYDPTGNSTGFYRSGETALVLSKSHQLSHFRLGVNSKFIFSNLVGYRASAFALDLGGVFIHPEQDFTVGLVIRNLGFNFASYTGTNSAALPFDVQAGLTIKPEHMPVRFSFTVFNLVRPGDAYDDPTDQESVSTLQKVMSHTNFGAEILVHRHAQILLGYNYLRQQELRLETGGGGTGFTYGLAAQVKSFQLIMAGSHYSTGNTNYTFTFAANLDNLIVRKRTL